MVQKVDCHHIITQPSVSSMVSAVKVQMTDQGYDLQVENLLPLSKVFPTFGMERPEHDYVAPYPPSTEQVDPNRVVIYIHSSGSTGFPKPIPQTEKITLQWCKTRKFNAFSSTNNGLMSRKL